MRETGELYEVEQKYPTTDVAALEARLDRLGATWHGVVEQTDRYFNHPSRDFAVTDEALRLRSTPEGVVITWKGPRLDATAKTRREIELPLAEAAVPAAAGAEAAVSTAPPATLAQWTVFLEALGFRRVREVAKRRRSATVPWAGAVIDIACDHVAGLGDFVELELRATADADVPAATSRIESLARELGCGRPERRSYLELLLEAAPDQ